MTILAHRNDPITSDLAAESLDRNANTVTKSAILALLAEEPRAVFALTEAYFNLREANGWPACKPDGIAKRTSELHVENRIEPSGRTAETPFGRQATVWQVAS
ncbi:MAG: hypothetical protein ABWX92_09910 [Mycetocola sp.]